MSYYLSNNISAYFSPPNYHAVLQAEVIRDVFAFQRVFSHVSLCSLSIPGWPYGKHCLTYLILYSNNIALLSWKVDNFNFSQFNIFQFSDREH